MTTKAELKDALVTLLGALERQVEAHHSINVNSAIDHGRRLLGPEMVPEKVDEVMKRTISATPRDAWKQDQKVAVDA